MKKLFNRCKGQVVLLLALCMMMVMSGCGAEATVESYAPGEELDTLIGFVEKAENAVDGANELASQQGGALGIEVPVATSEPATITEPAVTESTVTEQTTQAPISGEYANSNLDPDGSYTTAEDVALYLYTYDELPDNFMTKKEARELGWSGGSLEPYAPGMCIGGDYFGNYEGVLPDGEYHECDIDTLGAKSRGAKRIVYSEDGRIYYTEDHYETFTLLYGEE